jgi:hypothetical protein
MLYLVMGKNYEHHPLTLLSVWSSRELASHEIHRLEDAGNNTLNLSVVTAELDTPSDQEIEYGQWVSTAVTPLP